MSHIQSYILRRAEGPRRLLVGFVLSPSMNRTPRTYLWNQFEVLDPAPMLLGFQAELPDHGSVLRCVNRNPWFDELKRICEGLSLPLAVRLCLRVEAIGQPASRSLTREIRPPIQQAHHSESGLPGRFC